MAKSARWKTQPATDGNDLLGTPLRDAAMAGHRSDSSRALVLLGDANPSVRAAALGALWRLDCLTIDTLVGSIGDPDAVVRRRAVMIAGQSQARSNDGRPSPGILDALMNALGERDSSVAEVAAWALGEWGHECAGEPVTVLCQVAEGHADPLCREAAVAALGAIGDPSGLPSVLSALDDKPAIRRRAAIALAAFDDPRAREGLTRCLGDRDWQVRQAAEDLNEG